MTDPAKTAILLEHVGIRIGGNVILDDVCAHVPAGSSTALVGPNGAGKTSLTLAVLGQFPHKGTITFPATEHRIPRFGFVPQKLQFDRDMPITVLDYLAAGIQKLPLFFGTKRSVKMQIEAILDELECRNLTDRRFGALSGGEMQRVLLAQALLQNPEILVLDEPTSGIDFKGGQICCELLNRVRQDRGFTQLMISHDLATVAAHATHVICLNHSVRAEGAPRKVLTHEVLTETFGLHLGIPDLHDLAENAETCSPACPYHHHHEHHHEGGNCSCSRN